MGGFNLNLMPLAAENLEKLEINGENKQESNQNRLKETENTQNNLLADVNLASLGGLEQEITQMTQELEQLIYRAESALIASESKNAKYNLPMSKVVEQVTRSQDKSRQNNQSSQTILHQENLNAYQAIQSAKQVLENFPNLAVTNYSEARQLWLDARRSLWDNYPVGRYFAQPEIRAMWVDRGTIVKARSKEDLKPLFDQMAEAGINTVFFEVLNASYPIYPSSIAPEQNPLTKGWDPLQAAIELAHERKMELHAWVWIFAAANEGHNRILNLPDDYLGPVLSKNPDWVNLDKNGQAFNRTPGFKKAFFDPANPRVRQYLFILLDEIATRYDVDGVQFDYIRYPFQDGQTKQTFGYGNSSRHLFKEIYGVDPIELTSSSPLWSQWIGFKAQQVDSFVTEASSRLRQKRPNLMISTAVFPMERRERLSALQQNWEEWINNGSVDLMVLMTYALHTGSFEDRTQPVHSNPENLSSFILPGIRLLNVPDKEAIDQIQLLRNMPTGGYALFAAENFNPRLQVIFKQTQGNSGGKTEPIPHRQPFPSALGRYQALQKEWNFLLINSQLAVDPRYLREWGREADLVASNLKKLADNPSRQNLTTAQNSLSSFRRKLTQWTAEQQKIKPLQVQSWENRLLTLENLLKFGERRL
jgi:uncharacterized lipoprotein YddW (UPF0748 family)